jgi:hypothetical protein
LIMAEPSVCRPRIGWVKVAVNGAFSEAARQAVAPTLEFLVSARWNCEWKTPFFVEACGGTVEPLFALQGWGDWSHHKVPSRSYLSNRFSTSDVFHFVHCSIYYAAVQLIWGLER